MALGQMEDASTQERQRIEADLDFESDAVSAV